MNQVIFFLIRAMFLIEIDGNPIILSVSGTSKPPNCPYGKCFIDRCTRICSCAPPEGSTSCTRVMSNNQRTSMECNKPQNSTDNCPLGQTYKDPIWTDNFICYCNNDASQTYECMDLSTSKPAEARDLLLTGNPEKVKQAVYINEGKRNSKDNIRGKLKFH